MKLKIYKSSAGSGKTYQLVQEYLAFALTNPQQFSRILAVTFTNKATTEMKERILETTYALATSSNHAELSKALQKNLHLDAPLLIQKAKALLFCMLHQYSNFHISTIDSFFQQVVRAFARDFHLPARYNIALNKRELLHEVVDIIFASESTDPRLRKHLLYLTNIYIEENERWDVRMMLKKFCETLEFIPSTKILHEISQCENPIELYEKWSSIVKKIITKFENTIHKKVISAYKIMEQFHIEPSDFHAYARNIFSNWEKKNFSYTTKKLQSIYENGIEEWTQKSKPNPMVIAAAKYGLHQHFIDIVTHLQSQKYITYNTAKEVLPSLSSYVVLVYVQQHLEEYKKSQEIILNSDNATFLNQMIEVTGDAPFVYEKTGLFFKQYLIDEFQDTSPEQWQNFRPLLENSLSMQNENMIVGDVKQSIYRFRGGDWRLLNHEIEQRFNHQCDFFSLTTNYRSAYHVVSGVNQLFPPLIKMTKDHFDIENVAKYQKTIASIYEDVEQESAPHRMLDEKKGVIQFVPCNKTNNNNLQDDEPTWKNQAIKSAIEKIEILQQKGVNPSEICILVRKSSEGREFIEALQSHSRKEAKKNAIYTIFSQDSLLLNNAICIQILITALRVINDESTLHLTTLGYLLNEYENEIENISKQQPFSMLDKFFYSNILLTVKKVKSLPFFDIFEALIQEWKLYRYKDENPYLESFMDVIYQYADNKINDVKYFLDYWEKEGSQLKLQSTEHLQAINLMTIHKAKGLQFPFVIAPFLDWNMFESGTLAPTLWVKTKEGSLFGNLPTLPIKFGNHLTNTEFAEYYYDEKFQMWVENINLLYVTITRAKEGFFGYFNKKASVNSIGHCILQSLKDNQAYNYNSQNEVFHIGGLKDILLSKHTMSEQSTFNINYEGMFSSENSVIIKATDQLIENTYFGTLVHQVLSEIIYFDDIENSLNNFEKRGKINVNEKKQILSVFSKLKKNVSIIPFFTQKKETEILTEVPIIIKSGHQLRIDRLHINKKKKSAIVIDFKTGDSQNKKTKQGYFNQVKQYTSVLKEMNFRQVEGYLIHLEDGVLEKVQ